MKKTIMTLAIVLGLGMASFAQNGGGLFQRGGSDQSSKAAGAPMVPNHGLTTSQDATPVGSGIVVLTAIGVAYLIGKNRKGE